MNKIRSLFGFYDVQIIGEITEGCNIETTDKDGYYISNFCGKAFLKNLSLTVQSISDNFFYNSVTSGSYRLEGATIEVLTQQFEG
jgi:hypothetical protein